MIKRAYRVIICIDDAPPPGQQWRWELRYDPDSEAPLASGLSAEPYLAGEEAGHCIAAYESALQAAEDAR